jgi:drug/metabolite transporter (DMT)-like permease
MISGDNMKKIKIGITFGIMAGIIDVIPMILQNLTWDANFSAFIMWVVNGFFISVVDIKLNPVIKGVAVSFLVILPTAVLIGWKEPFTLLPISVMTLILGSLLGFLIEKYGKK